MAPPLRGGRVSSPKSWMVSSQNINSLRFHAPSMGCTLRKKRIDRQMAEKALAIRSSNYWYQQEMRPAQL